MNDEELISRFGLPANPQFRQEIKTLLRDEIETELDDEGTPDTFRCLMAQLFSIGNVEDSLLIWEAKNLSFDLMCGMDIQFLCGAGLEETIQFLSKNDDELAQDALFYLKECVDAGDFIDWSPEKLVQNYRQYFGVK